MPVYAPAAHTTMLSARSYDTVRVSFMRKQHRCERMAALRHGESPRPAHSFRIQLTHSSHPLPQLTPLPVPVTTPQGVLPPRRAGVKFSGNLPPLSARGHAELSALTTSSRSYLSPRFELTPQQCAHLPIPPSPALRASHAPHSPARQEPIRNASRHGGRISRADGAREFPRHASQSRQATRCGPPVSDPRCSSRLSLAGARSSTVVASHHAWSCMWRHGRLVNTGGGGWVVKET